MLNYLIVMEIQINGKILKLAGYRPKSGAVLNPEKKTDGFQKPLSWRAISKTFVFDRIRVE